LITRSWFVAVLGVSAFFLSTQPAAAQGSSVQFAAGYQFLRFLDDGGENIPAGWGASVAGGSSVIKVVGDVGGHYEDGEKLHTFQGGIEVAGSGTRTTPFVRGLVGGATFSGGDTVFVFTPEAGVRFMGPGRVGAQVSAGFPIMRDEGETEKTFRLFAGIVVR
jgi:hypothetical protein